jgi:CheY-like chemotaxis protein
VTERVIVADDDRVTSHLLCAILRSQGFVPAPAFDIPEIFVACARPPRPAAILLDLNMPGGTGIGTIVRLKGDAALRDIPVVVVSGSDDPADRADSLRAGAAAFVTKPIGADTLLAALHAALGG